MGIPRVYFMENPIEMDDLQVPLFQETSSCVEQNLKRLEEN